MVPPKITSAKPRSAAREVAVGDVLRSRYRVIGVLGHGGMGTVFEAADEYRLDLLPSGQRIAIKVLHSAVTEREELLRELQREFQHLQSLSHPHIVRVHEFDRDGDTAFFTMELLSGALLSGVLNARNAVALLRAHALAVIRDVGAALSHAHSCGVVHGDVNPQNIFITNEGELRVLDFGAAHSMRRTSWTAADESPQSAPVATPGYASCQLLEGQRPDARDDVFAFACVMYLLLSGKHPFPGYSAVEARAKHVRASRPDGLTGSQWRVLREGLNWDRARRPSEVQNWLVRLNLQGAAPRLPLLSHLMTSAAPRSSRGLLAAVAVLVLALLAAAAYWVATNYDAVTGTVAGWHLPGSSDAPRTDVSPALPAPASSAAPASRATMVAAPAAAGRAPPPIPEAAPAPPPSRHPALVAATSATAAPNLPPPARPTTLAAPPGGERAASVPAVNVGPVRIEMVADTVDVLANEKSAHVAVHRRGDPRGTASFTWWTESGTAKPGVDFVPVMPHTEVIEGGSNGVTLDILVSNAPRHASKSFYVVIDRVESGAQMGARTLTMVTIQPGE
ncbi:MAG: protein kinase [Gammaproteobacteria bacterium]